MSSPPEHLPYPQGVLKQVLTILRPVLQCQWPLESALYDGCDDFLKVEHSVWVTQRQMVLSPLCSPVGQVEAANAIV